MVGTIEARAGFITELTASERLKDLVERTVQMVFPPLVPAVDRILALVKDRDKLYDELKQVVLSLPYDGVWRALDSMYILRSVPDARMIEEVDHQTEDSGSVLSSVIAPTKREREEDVDEEMGSAVMEDQHDKERNVPTIVENGETEIRNVSLDGTEEGGVDDPIPEVDEEKTFLDHLDA